MRADHHSGPRGPRSFWAAGESTGTSSDDPQDLQTVEREKNRTNVNAMGNPRIRIEKNGTASNDSIHTNNSAMNDPLTAETGSAVA